MFKYAHDYTKNNQITFSRRSIVRGMALFLSLGCLLSAVSSVYALTVQEAVNSLQTATPGLPGVDNPKGNIGHILANIFYGSADGAKNGKIRPEYLDGLGTWASTGANTYFTLAGNVGIGTSSPAYKLDVSGDTRTAGWFRSTGSSGWVNDTFGGGWYMSDTTWMRTYGSKNIYQNTGILRTDGTFQVGNNGDTFSIGYGGNLSYRTNVLFANTAGNVGIGTNAPSQKLTVIGKSLFSRDGIAECCGNDATIAIGESTSITGKKSSISFHNSGVAEGTIELTGTGTTPRIMMYSSQVGQKIGLEVTGNAIAAEPTAANHLATKNYVDSKAGSGNDQPILTTILFGENGDIPVRTTSTSPVSISNLYGPFAYAVSALICPVGTTKQHKISVAYVDNISSGGQIPKLRIAFSGGANRDFTLLNTWGADSYYRTYLSDYFTETNFNHATLQLWVNGTSGPYITMRKVELLTFCR